MTFEEVVWLASVGRLDEPGGASGPCELCGELVDDEPVVAFGRIAVHASCAAGAVALARKSAGHEPLRGVSGVVCGACRRSFRHADQAVIVGREGAKTALHVRPCRRARAR